MLKEACGLILMGYLAVGPADAGQAERVEEALTKEELIEALKPDHTAETGGLTRSIRISTGEKSAEPKFKNVRIDFASGSDRLSQSAVSKLEPMGEALSSPRLKGLSFILEGHTDSVGRASDNERLSLRRAESVKRYLESHYGIDSERIEAVGKGERELLDTNNPNSPVNRRVKIIARP